MLVILSAGLENLVYYIERRTRFQTHLHTWDSVVVLSTSNSVRVHAVLTYCYQEGVLTARFPPAWLDPLLTSHPGSACE